MKILILGGGLTGMAAADKLIEKHDVTILEKAPFLGGLASSFEHDGKRIPRHYHHIFAHDHTTIRYLKRFNLFVMVWSRIRMGIAVNGRQYDFTTIKGLLNFNYLSWYARMRYGLFGIYALFLMHPERIKETVDAQAWLHRYAGKEVTKKLFYHLYGKNKYDIPLTDISAKELAYRVQAREAIGHFCYPRKGLHAMVDALESSLHERGCVIKKGYDAKKVDLEKRRIDTIKADIIINTIPLPVFLNLAKGLPEGYASQLAQIKYCPVINVVFGTKKFLSRYYWLNVLKEPVGILVQHSKLFDGYPTKVTWAGKYGVTEEDMQAPDEVLEAKFLGVVKKYFPKVEIVWSKVSKERFSSPIYDKDYARKKPSYKTPLPGFYQAGIAVTYPKVRNMNIALESGLTVADIIAKESV